MMNYAEPIVKKSRMEVDLSWDSTCYRKPPSLVKQWNLQNSFISVHSDKKGVRVQICEFGQNGSGASTSTRGGIFMLPATWSEFIEKFWNFNVVYTRAGFISNNQLLITNSEDKWCHLQQLCRRDNQFVLKQVSVKISQDEITKLLDFSQEISECILESIFCRALPYFLSRGSPKTCMQSMHSNESETKATVFRYVCEEVEKSLSTHFYCTGCVVDHPSQRRHECLTITNSEKYKTIGELQTLLALNIWVVGQNLIEKQCTCYFNRKFFDKILLEDYQKYLSDNI